MDQRVTYDDATTPTSLHIHNQIRHNSFQFNPPHPFNSSTEAMLDPRIDPANNQAHTFDPFGRMNNSHVPYRDISFDAKVKKTAQNYENFRNSLGRGVQFMPGVSEDETGVHSPPLWKTSPPRHQQNNHRSFSPSSRAQAIARGQLELMEMVQNMPESSYELSLKDIVERPRISQEQEDCLIDKKDVDEDDEYVSQRVKVGRQGSKKNDQRALMVRTSSLDNRGMFLKMVFPITWRSKKKKTLETNTCAKVSPKPEANDNKSSKSVDKEWRKKGFSVSDNSESGMSSSNSGSTGSSGGSSRKPNCWPNLWSKKTRC